MRFTVFTLTLLAAATTNAFAAEAEPTAWLRVQTDVPYDGKAPLYFNFQPDEEVCKKQYGDDWYDACRRPIGSRLRSDGVVMTPAVRGTWRWLSSTLLTFEPAESWPAAKEYRFDFSKLSLPVGTKLAATALTLRTKPLSLLSSNVRFWADRTPAGAKLVTLDLRFSSAPDRETFESRFAMRLPKGLSLEKPSFEWTDDGLGVYVRMTVRALPAATGTATFELPGVASRLDQAEQLRPRVAKGFESTKLDLRVPGRDELFYVENAGVNAARTDEFRSVYELALTPSMRMTPADVAKNLRVTLLPEKWRADAPDAADWSRAGELTDAVLSRGTPVAVTPVTSSDLPTDTIRLRFDAPENRWVHVSLAQGTGPEGAKLAKTWTEVFRTPVQSPEIRFLLPGNLMTLSGERSLPFTVRGAERIRAEVAKIRAPFAAQVMQAWNGLNVVRHADELADIQTLAPALVAMKEGSSVKDGAWSRIELPEAAGLYQITLVGEAKNDRGEWREVARTVRTTLVSDRALLAKETPDGTVTLFDARLTTGEPSPGDAVTLLAANGTVLAEGKTDDSGRISIAVDPAWTRDKKTAALFVRGADGDLSLLSLTDPSNLSGAAERGAAGRLASADTLLGLSFAERGVVRPGETARFGALVKTRDWSALPADLPLRVRLTGPSGEELANETVKPGETGLVEFSYETKENLPSGKLVFDLIAGDVTLSTTAVALEPFTPETMELSAAPETRRAGWLSPDEARFALTLTGLYGGPAAERTVEANVFTRAAGAIRFERYPDFTFLDAYPFDAQAADRRLPALVTNDKGEARLTIAPEHFFGRTARARIVLQGFEAPGRSGATKVVETLVSPADAMLGWRTEGAGTTFLTTGEKGAIRIKLVDRDLKPLAGERVKLVRSERSDVRELVTTADGRAAFRSTSLLKPVDDTAVTLDASGEALVTLPSDRAGDFVFTAETQKGVKLGDIAFTVADETLKQAAMGGKIPSVLRVHFEQKEIPEGGTVSAAVASPFEGFGLMTLESDKLHAAKWVKVKAGENRLDLPVPEGVEGRAYWRLSLVRAKSEDARLIEPYVEATEALSIAPRARDLGLSADLPETIEIRPGSDGSTDFTLYAKEKGSALVWAVDEGILSLTNYQTPDPLARLLLDRALEVGTRQTLSRLMPEGFPYAQKLPAFGGDLVAEASGALANPFGTVYDAPALWWSGIVPVGPEGTPLTMKLPEGFAGRVRLMAVGASDDKAGSFSEDVTVTAPVLLRLPAPSTFFEGDSVDLPVRITNTTDQPLEGTLTVKGEFLAQALKRPVAIGPGETRTETVRVTASRLGRFTLEASLSSGDALMEGVTAKLEGSVRPTSLLRTEVMTGRFTKEAPSLTLSNAFLPFDEETTLVASATPVALLTGLADPRPFTKTAALTDALALLPLRTMAKETAERLAPVYGLAPEEVARRLLSDLTDAGRLYEEDTLFAAAEHLEALLTLRAQAPDLVSAQDLREAKETLERLLALDPADLGEARDAAYALWVLTREGTLVADSLALLTERATARGLDLAEDLAGLLVAAAEREMQIPVEAPAKTSSSPSGAWTSTVLSALEARLRTTTFAQKSLPETFLAEVSDATRAALASDDEKLQSALTLLAAKRTESAAPAIACLAPDAKKAEATGTSGTTVLAAPGCTTFGASNFDATLYWTVLRKGYEAKPAARSESVSIDRRFTLEDGTEVTPETKLPAGTLLRMTITLTPESDRNEALWAVSQLLPAGTTLETSGELAPAGDGLERIVKTEGGVQFLLRTPFGFAASVDAVLRTGLPGTVTVPPAAVSDVRRPAREAVTGTTRWTLVP